MNQSEVPYQIHVVCFQDKTFKVQSIPSVDFQVDESAKSTEPPPVEDIDAFSELTPQDVLEVVESVTKDLMSGLQVS